MPRRKATAKRQLIDTGRDKRYVRRSKSGQFKEADDVGRSLSQDRRRKAKSAAKPGQGDRGDRTARASTTRSARSQTRTASAQRGGRSTAKRSARAGSSRPTRRVSGKRTTPETTAPAINDLAIPDNSGDASPALNPPAESENAERSIGHAPGVGR